QMMAYESPVPEELRATPARCGHWATELDACLRALENASVRVPAQSRLRRSVSLLKDVAQSGCLPVADTDRRCLANALRSAYDLKPIFTLLPPTSDSTILGDIGVLVKGTIDESEPQRRPYEFQSRVWVQAVFHNGGVETKALPVHQAGPDFLLQMPTGRK